VLEVHDVRRDVVEQFGLVLEVMAGGPLPLQDPGDLGVVKFGVSAANNSTNIYLLGAA